jgi:hypothetical protein
MYRFTIIILIIAGIFSFVQFYLRKIRPGSGSSPMKARRVRTKREKAFNKRLARDPVVIKHVNAGIKTFKSMAYPYLNHCRRHLLRTSLLYGIINYELLISGG